MSSRNTLHVTLPRGAASLLIPGWALKWCMGILLSLSGNQTSPFPLVTSSLLNGTPREGTIKLNTDRAAKNIRGTGGLGGVFRDHNDKWLLDFYESLAHTSPVEAELKAIWRGLQLAIQHNFMHLQAETDSKEAVEGIMSGILPFDNIIFCHLNFDNITFLLLLFFKKYW